VSQHAGKDVKAAAFAAGTALRTTPATCGAVVATCATGSRRWKRLASRQRQLCARAGDKLSPSAPDGDTRGCCLGLYNYSMRADWRCAVNLTNKGVCSLVPGPWRKISHPKYRKRHSIWRKITHPKSRKRQSIWRKICSLSLPRLSEFVVLGRGANCNTQL
jgi:hypothetical protein